MGGIPDLMFVIDTNKEAIAIQEARKLNIPVVAILDTNCDPAGITFPIPGNDDAARALQLYCDLIADSVLDGLAAGQAASGVDIGASEAPSEPVLKMVSEPEAAPAKPVVAKAEPAPVVAEAEPAPVVAEAESAPVAAEAEAEPAVEPAAEPALSDVAEDQ
jgi:small subunit ribosomal protein S2